MSNVHDVMASIYDVLSQLRYPHISNVESKDVGATVLSGENRVCLLSWLLTEKSSLIADRLRKLKDAALEDQLFEYYTQIGICNNKDVLLGKCSMKEQLPTLRLLLDFTRKVHMEFPVNANEEEESIMDIVKMYTDGVDQTPCRSILKSKLNYAEASKYFEESEKELSDSNCADTKSNMSNDTYMEVNDRLVSREEEDALFNKEEEKFIEAFQTVSSWPFQSRNLDQTVVDSISSDIKKICSNFFTLKKILRAKDEISNMDLTKRLPKTITPLNATIEDIIIYNEELENQNLTDNVD
ncbi:PREDICTED: uncharacterized protein LOC106746340 [Dinoponera quadriceps]|uniref:Uncharacterized protein LOC106746340 n=1 Tax=Dinoponera quadriceps TaxID=609295 RepID=A0A6P3XK21_DINQU|nr:PREDICTED: uncharacterized protein LOC106746340 [Dinoponera quadriceps]